MPFSYLGTETRLYPQYLNTATDTTLIADSGSSYDMWPAGGLNLPVPPADGLWGIPQDPPADDPPGEPEPAPAELAPAAEDLAEPPANGKNGNVPPPLTAPASTENEE